MAQAAVRRRGDVSSSARNPVGAAEGTGLHGVVRDERGLVKPETAAAA